MYTVKLPKNIRVSAEKAMFFCTLYSIARLIPRYETNHQETEWSEAETEKTTLLSSVAVGSGMCE